MKNSNNLELPKIVIKFSNMLFGLGFLISSLFVVYVIYKIYNLPHGVSQTYYIVALFFGVLLILFFAIGFKTLNDNLKANLAILLFVTSLTVFGFNLYLEFSKTNSLYLVTDGEEAAKKIGASYDGRTNLEVLKNLKVEGYDAFPSVFPGLFRESNGLKIKNGNIYPLGGISNKTIINCNEGGIWSVYESDEYGFNNSKGLYIENKVDILLIGDSFVEGACVKPIDSISSVLNTLGLNSISIGKGSNGPLTELASLKEYAKPIKPKVVLWMYYVNDLTNDLESELKSSILKKYLYENDYSQNLFFRQEEIDSLLIKYIENKLENKILEKNVDIVLDKSIDWHKIKARISNILKLSHLRKMTNLKPKSANMKNPIFRDILKKSQEIISGWGGKMYFVYLPDFATYSTGSEHLYRNFVIQTATDLNIPIIDIHSEIFEPHPDPLSFFPLRVAGHYNKKGYKLISELISKRLKKDGYITIKSKK